MKLTYNFIDSLHNLLKSDHWSVRLEDKINELENKLSLTAAHRAEEAFKNRNFSDEQKAKILKIKQEIIAQFELEKKELELCLENNIYKLGIPPFQNLDETRMLLVNSHVLDTLYYQHFNHKAVQAVKNMLREEFNSLYQEKDYYPVWKFISSERDHNLSYGKTIKGIISLDHIIQDDRILPNILYPNYDNYPDPHKAIVNNICNNFSLANKEVVKGITEKLEFIFSFFPQI